MSAVELLQFGVYRGIELAGWYDILNIGYRFPCVGASDYPACRKLGDCQTFVSMGEQAGFAGWLKGAVGGAQLCHDRTAVVARGGGQRARGDHSAGGTGPHRVRISVRVMSHVAPVQIVQIIAGGKVVAEERSAGRKQGRWIEIERTIELDQSSWIAARALGRLAGRPDAEAHTNPVYVDIGEKAPYGRDSLDRLVSHLDGKWRSIGSGALPRRPACWIIFRSRATSSCGFARRAGAAGGVPDDWIDDNRPRRRSTPAVIAQGGRVEGVPRAAAGGVPDVLKTFEAVDGFTMQLVAEEPRVQSPVAAAFDADGDLYVAEMRDYPYKPKPGGKPLGSVRLFHNRDGDGRFEESHVFAEGLLWAAGIAPWKGGVFVTAPPDIWYLKDTDGDGKAHVRQLIYTGFGTQNQQAMGNN